MLTYDNHGNSEAHLNDRSYFINTDFIIDDEYPFNGHVQHFTARKCNGFRIEGCTFHDQRTGMDPWDKRNGLILSASTVRLDERCIPSNPQGDCTETRPTRFIDLHHGIKSYGQTHPLFMTEIKNSEFISNWNGVYLLNSRDAEVWNNDFEVTPIGFSPQGDKYIPYPTGIYLHHQTRGYSIEENRLYPEENSTGPTTLQAFGIVANTSHGDPMELFNNDVRHLTVGIESIGQNWTDDGPVGSGLQLKCNNFDRNSTDISIVKGPSTYDYYGLFEQQGATGDPVLNEFVLDASLVNISNELEPFENSINYFYDESTPIERPDKSYYDAIHADPPQYPQNIHLIATTVPIGEKCPSMFGNDVVLLMSSQDNAQASYEQQVDILHEVLDGGDTEGLEAEVQLATNTDAWEKYLYMMSEAGYITEEVLKEVASKEDGFTMAMIRDILVANPHAAKSKEIDEKLSERATQLPEYMIAQIKAGLAEISPKEYLQMIQNQYYHEFVRNGLAIHHHLLRDSLPPDSLYFLLGNLEASGHSSFDYQLVETYKALGQTDLASQKLSMMQADGRYSEKEAEELSRYVQLNQQLDEWRAVDGSVVLNEERKDILIETTAVHDRAGVTAMGILMHADEDTFDKPVVLPKAVEKSRRTRGQKTDSFGDLLDVFPNPADDHITISYSLVEFKGRATLRVIDLKGVVRWERVINDPKDQLVIPLNLEQGHYTLELRSAGRTVAGTKLQIQ